MKKNIGLVVITLVSIPCFAYLDFSFLVGGAGNFSYEHIPDEEVKTSSSAGGLSLNLMVFTKINIGFWLHFDYLVPLLYEVNKEKQDLSTVLTESINFSIGPAYLFVITKKISLPVAVGFSVNHILLVPRYSRVLGLSFHTGIRYTVLENFFLSAGVMGVWGFHLTMLSAGEKYERYTLFSVQPYLSVGLSGRIKKN
ncbi:MAG: hypothetical protein ACRC5H_02385 [Treponemataceae bacterium]